MNHTIIKLKYRDGKRSMIILFTLSFLLSAALSLSYQDESIKIIDNIRLSFPQWFVLMGFDGSLNPVFHLAGMIYGFFMPLFMAVACAIFVKQTILLPVRGKEIGAFLLRPGSKKEIGLSLYLSALLLMIPVCVISLIAQSAVVLAFFTEKTDYWALARLNIGLLAMSFALISLFSGLALGLKDNAGKCIGIVVVAGILLLMLSRLGIKFKVLEYLTPFAFFSPKEILAGSFIKTLWAIPFGIGCVALGLLGFEKREFF